MEQQLDLQSFLYHRQSYYGEFIPETLVFNANLQEFATRISYISNLQTNGKPSPQEPYSDRGQYPLPVLIVTDLQMPRLNGLELLTWVKQQSTLDDLPVIMMSGANNPDFVNQAIDLGAKSFILKTNLDNLALDIVRAVTE